MEIFLATVGNGKLAYHVFGAGKIDLVIEMGLGAVMGEWWQLAQRLSGEHTVLLYERAGYGSSTPSPADRTSKNIAVELHELLEVLDCESKITLLAHSQGGLYAQQFARSYPQLVEKLVLLDPLSPKDNDFCNKLTRQEFQKSGVDKISGLRLNLLLARLHLGWLLRQDHAYCPPFYYYDGFSEEETRYMLAAISRPQTYETALREYEAAHDERFLGELVSSEGFPSIPLVLITHDSGIEKQEICQFGGASEEEAQKIENVWQELMGEYLSYSPDSTHLRAEHSSHYIHLTDPELVCEVLAE